MRKYLIFILMVCFFGLESYAQPKSYFTVRGGYSVTLGEYSSNNYETGAFTSSGISLGVDGAWFFYKNIGLVADFNYSLHSVDAATLATEIFYAFEDPLLNNLYVRSDPYKVITFMLGINYNYKLLDKLSIEPRVLSGLLMAYTPFQLIETEYFILADDYFKKTSSRDQSIAFKAGLSIKYDLSNCLAISLSGDYTTANMSFGFIGSKGRYYRDQKIAYLDLSFGLVYKL